MATVWKAYHPALDRYVAMKVLLPSFKEDPQFTERQCDLALQMDPEVPEGQFCMGLYYAKQGDTDRARSEFEIVVDTAPGFLAEQARRQLDRLD
jgi:hypothetical protein